MTSRSFCKWVNNELLPNNTLEPGFPRQVSLDVCRKWFHIMGFQVKQITKGIYIDGHERDDVVQARKEFVEDLTKLGFLNVENAPNEEQAAFLPDVEVSADSNNTIFLFS